MTAQIIQFPQRRAEPADPFQAFVDAILAKRAQERSEDAAHQSWTYPPDWTDAEQHFFGHFRRDGASIEEAVGKIEFTRWSARMIPGETPDARLLRQAREAIRAMKSSAMNGAA